jgi:stalled ribosome rescue protein Dom34
MGASESLLILKDYLSKLEDEEKLTSIFSNITRYKGRICFLDNKTNTGIQLESLGGIAVLLRYKIK